ncbi:MerR family transcriptional regulator [Paucibacter sp. APW11]|uniref:MerR family transcriptional regulator n=1 Tax=Roseateles aquae TaxID=3077235 RepID=A0ABU3PI01_9BURK|nr:MerR family transcriptional regulator [Paucibacter sp. APW11]MDT9001992.1 MerR family transcriptional regulator [Paucibacter sp. APW11]
MRIAEIERRAGLSRDTLRYYERIGLISPPRRGANNYREYEAHNLVELGFIRRAQEIGFTLDEIRAALPHLRQPPDHCPDLIAALQAKRAQIAERLAAEQLRLQRVDEMLARLNAPGKT